MPAARRTSLVGAVDAATAFAEISKWIGEFMAAHVARAAAQR
ncbi:MAG TPA: hypothetical protein VFO58_18035 [Vicinamibacterales bacterium]|nr:hypothetical protein [Vicinamibacterales bacterium]